MKVSIITAIYNSERNIHDCLQSVTKQAHKNIEHIIVDGASTGNTLEFVKNSPLVTRWISEPDHGIYDALNKGIKLATGDVIGFLHSDDLLADSTIIERIANSFSQKIQNSASSLPSGEMSGSPSGFRRIRQEGGRTERSGGR